MSDQRIDDFRETHFPIEELGQTFCAEDSQHWPCDSGYVLDALTAAQATIAARDAQVERLNIERTERITAYSLLNAQVAELTAALQAVMRRIDRTGKACWCPPIFDDRTFHTSDCLRAKELMARTPAAPEGETASE